MDWRTYYIRPGGRPGTRPERFYAPSLDLAFASARARWPHATSWEWI